MSKKKLIIVGDGEFAEIAYEYFTHDSDYEVACFAVETEFLTKSELYGLPVISVDDIEKKYPAAHYDVFVAITFTKLNRVRTRLFHFMKQKGYKCATYISSRAFVWRNATLGENCFIFENNVIQHHVTIGDNVIMWSGNHVGHRSSIGNNCFLSSHVVVSGYCNIGENSFLGVNSTLVDNITLGKDCFIGAGSLVTKNVENVQFCKSTSLSKISSVSTHSYFGISS